MGRLGEILYGIGGDGLRAWRTWNIFTIAIVCQVMSESQANATNGTNADASAVTVSASVPDLRWGTDRETTYVGALASALSVTAHPFTYDELMAASGLAFRTRWWRGASGGEQQFCPSSPVGEFPREVARLDQAIGWVQQVDVRFSRPGGFPDRLDDIKGSIEAGLPLLAYTQNTNVGVVYGFQGERLMVKDYDHGDMVIGVEELGPLA